FGKTEFEVRDLVLKIGAKAYEERLREKKRLRRIGGRVSVVPAVGGGSRISPAASAQHCEADRASGGGQAASEDGVVVFVGIDRATHERNGGTAPGESLQGQEDFGRSDAVGVAQRRSRRELRLREHRRNGRASTGQRGRPGRGSHALRRDGVQSHSRSAGG